MTREELLKEYEQSGTTMCEPQLPDCMGRMFLTIAHRHKRHWYKGQEELLWSWEQTVLACQRCHDKIEYDKELTEEVFNELRGEE